MADACVMDVTVNATRLLDAMPPRGRERCAAGWFTRGAAAPVGPHGRRDDDTRVRLSSEILYIYIHI